jgi:hypothetical protein
MIGFLDAGSIPATSTILGVNMQSYDVGNASIFKYMIFNIHALQTIIQRKIYFNHISNYNDPAEVLLDYSYRENYYAYQKLKNSCRYPDFDHIIEMIIASKKAVNPKFNKHSPSDVENDLPLKIATEIQSKYRCCSFSKSIDILLFSHYANSCRGICLEFDSSSPFFDDIHEVEYIYSYHKTFIGFISKVHTIKGAYLRKMKEWKYENEYRLIKEANTFRSHELSNQGYLTTFPRGVLKSVILGSRISRQDRDLIFHLKREGIINANIVKSEVTSAGIQLLKYTL